MPSQLPAARIMSYGYDSKTLFTESAENISDIAKNLLEHLSMKRKDVQEMSRPIMFISHSLGGIIVKEVGGSSQLLILKEEF